MRGWATAGVAEVVGKGSGALVGSDGRGGANDWGRKGGVNSARDTGKVQEPRDKPKDAVGKPRVENTRST